MRLVDTNVLHHAASTAEDERDKRERALAILEDEDLCLSVQVLQEFYAPFTRASRRDRLEHDQACALVEAWLRFPAVEITVSLVRDAIAAAKRWRTSYWDAAIVEAAREAGCAVLLSEDLQDGMDFDGVTVVNPFA